MHPRIPMPIPPPPPLQPQANRNANGVELPKIFTMNLDEMGPKKPWNQPNQDITDYFNYGFNEETWKLYALQVQKVFQKEDIKKQTQGKNMLINTELPVEAGGFGQPLNKDLRKFECFKMLFKNLEKFWLAQNFNDNDFYNNFDDFIKNVLYTPTFEMERAVLMQYFEEKDIDIDEAEVKKIVANSKSPRQGYGQSGQDRFGRGGRFDYYGKAFGQNRAFTNK